MSETNLIVTAQWLHDHLHDPDIAIADCRFDLMQPNLGSEQYHAGHIPGAYHLDLKADLSAPVGKHGGRHPLPDPAELSAKLAAMGIHSDAPAKLSTSPTLVVIYDDSRFAYASRLWWLLSYLGHDRVAVLDGGFAAWIKAGYAVSTELPSVRPGLFIPRPRPEMLVDIETVKARKDVDGVVLIDAREGDRYRGEREPIDPIAGHIPGAVNYPWQNVTDAQGFFRQTAMRSQWAELAQAQEIISYCGSGVTACVNLLSLKIAGINTAKLYAGSWSDWCSYL